MTRHFLRWCAGLTLALGLAAPAAADTLRIGLITPPGHQWTKSAEALSARLAAETGGRLDLSVHPAGQLGSEAQMLQQLQTGALDLAFFTVGELAMRDADFGALLAPYLVADIAGAQRLLHGPTAQGLLEKARPMGLEGLGFGLAGMRQVLLAKPAATGADLAGRKIRTVPLPQELDFWTKVGATPTPLPLPALYDAMANGQIDGMQIDYEGVWNSRYFDLGQQMLATDHMIFPSVAVASARRWAALPEADRTLIAGAVRAELDAMFDAYAAIDADYRARIEGAGFTVTPVGRDFFGTAVDDWYAEWRVKTPVLLELEAEAAH
ncbi:TRAP transporter substrate-binding protein [Ruixingdingia sedimenti]|uniref:TRAP transporter substrate-binding protein n=1 Tax=Ruixingdingia sedimenti TaxID=3073604 RepID=A0ABU1F2H3_9RHOB|nr:TRAP transporter substrate-binding protein [Xinfangfangia sp. LG-4]MDR5651067.1 TRAP transporter substrate-binding protein [Xinfangfangia sp. LG-4]